MANPSEARTPSRIERILLSSEIPLIPKLVLFLLFTFILVGVTFYVLPQLVVLGPWGYAAALVINLLSSATVVIPGPGFTATMVMAKELNPFLLGIVVGVGGTLGEMTGYWLGAQGRESVEGNRFYGFIMAAMSKAGGAIILIFGLLPLLPVDAAGVLAGASRYPASKFLIYLGIGKIIMSILLMYAAARAFEWAEPYLKWLG